MSKLTQFKKGAIPHNKGIQLPHVKKKLVLVKNGEKVECKKHGFHDKWRIHSRNNVQCKLCSTEIQKKRRELYPIRFLLQDAKHHAKSKKISFDLSEKDIIDLLNIQKNKCALSGIEFDEENKFSLDRINPEEGYIKSNVQLLTFEVNRIKTNVNQDRFVELCKLISENQYAKKNPY